MRHRPAGLHQRPGQQRRETETWLDAIATALVAA
jgi:hypothetical protein